MVTGTGAACTAVTRQTLPSSADIANTLRIDDSPGQLIYRQANFAAL
jgi:hypothetical protein